MSNDIYKRLEDSVKRILRKIDGLEEKAKRKAEKEAKKERIIELARGMNIFDKIKLILKII